MGGHVAGHDVLRVRNQANARPQQNGQHQQQAKAANGEKDARYHPNGRPHEAHGRLQAPAHPLHKGAQRPAGGAHLAGEVVDVLGEVLQGEVVAAHPHLFGHGFGLGQHGPQNKVEHEGEAPGKQAGQQQHPHQRYIGVEVGGQAGGHPANFAGVGVAEQLFVGRVGVGQYGRHVVVFGQGNPEHDIGQEGEARQVEVAPEAKVEAMAKHQTRQK